MFQTDDVRINRVKELLPPVAVLEKFPTTETAASTTFDCRNAIHNILKEKTTDCLLSWVHVRSMIRKLLLNTVKS